VGESWRPGTPGRDAAFGYQFVGFAEEGVMQAGRLPKRVPVGTKYIIEGKSQGQGEVHVFSRILLFPDGRCFDLPSDAAPPAAMTRRRRASAAKRH
jgi:hypothetical protein